MKKAITADTLINIGFFGGLGLKALNAVVEIIGGFFMTFISHYWVNRFILMIALPELSEDPDDPLMNYLITFGQNFSSSSQHLVGAYMLLHGITKLVIIVLLLERKLWAFPVGVAVFGLFIIFELFSYIHGHSLIMLFIVIFDVIILAMIILEYQRLKP